MTRRIFTTKQIAKPETPADYTVSITARCIQKGYYFGQLSITRKTDGRVLYPFDGAPDIGPFHTFSEARDAAQTTASRLIGADLLDPEM